MFNKFVNNAGFNRRCFDEDGEGRILNILYPLHSPYKYIESDESYRARIEEKINKESKVND